MRAVLLVGLCLTLTGRMKKTDLGPLPPFTRVEISQSESPDSFFPPDAGREKTLTFN